MEEEYDTTEPYLKDLFRFDAPALTKGMATTSMEWSRTQPDLLAVSYGDTACTMESLTKRATAGGLMLFWSVSFVWD